MPRLRLFGRVRWLSLSLTFMLGLMLLANVAGAAERVHELPTLEKFNSFRFEIAMTQDTQIFAVGRGFFESPERGYFVLKAVPEQPDYVIEVVQYDGMLYTREGTSKTWYREQATVDSIGPDIATGIDPTVPLTRLESMLIGGVPATQYQFYMNEYLQDMSHEHPKYGYLSTADFWIGDERPFVHQLQVSEHETVNDEVVYSAEIIERFYDFNADLKVNLPPNAKSTAVRPGSTSFKTRTGLMGAALTPLRLPQTKKWAAQRHY